MPFGHIRDWYLTQCTLLWPEKYACRLCFGRQMDRALPPMNAHHFSSGAPFLLTAWKKVKNLSGFTLPMNYFEPAVVVLLTSARLLRYPGYSHELLFTSSSKCPNCAIMCLMTCELTRDITEVCSPNISCKSHHLFGYCRRWSTRHNASRQGMATFCAGYLFWEQQCIN